MRVAEEKGEDFAVAGFGGVDKVEGVDTVLVDLHLSVLDTDWGANCSGGMLIEEPTLGKVSSRPHWKEQY